MGERWVKTPVLGSVLLVRKPRQAARLSSDPDVAALWSAAIGLAIGALFLLTWNEFAVSGALWGLAGAVLGAARQGARHPGTVDEDVSDQQVVDGSGNGEPRGRETQGVAVGT